MLKKEIFHYCKFLSGFVSIISFVFVGISLLFLLMLNIASADIQTGLVSYWSLDEETGETRYDEISEYDLTDNGTVPSVSGYKNNAVQITSGKYLTRADNAALSTGGGKDFTVSLWVRLDEKTGTQVFVSKFNDVATGEYAVYFENGNDRFMFSTYTNGQGYPVQADSLGSPEIGQWYHIVAIHNAETNTNTIIIDGTISDSVGEVAQHEDTNAPFVIGGFGGATFTANATIDEVRFYSRVLSNDDVLELHQNDLRTRPRFVTGNAGNITKTTATLEAMLYLGDIDTETLGFIYADNGALDGATEIILESGEYEEGAFSQEIESLVCEQEYFFQAFVIDAEEEKIDGDIVSFTTADCDDGEPTPNQALYYMLRQEIAPGTYWTSVKTSADGNKLVATGFNQLGETMESFAYISNDGGETWEHKGTFPDIFITSVGMANNDDLIFALGFNFGFSEEGEFMVLIGTEDDGENWMTAPLYIDLDEFDFFSEMDWILFSRINVGDNLSHIYITILDKLLVMRDFNPTWELVFDLEGDGIFSSLSASQNGQKILATEAFNEFGGRVFFSDDYGATGGVVLDVEDLDGYMPFSSAMSPDGMRMFVTAVSPDMHMSLDGGETWTIATNPDGYGWMYVMPSTAGSKIVASAFDYENEKIAIYFSNDNGTTWVKQDEILLSIEIDEYLELLFFAVGNISGSQNLSRLGLVTFLELFTIVRGVPDLPPPPTGARSRTTSGGMASPALLAQLGITPQNQSIEYLLAQVKELQELLAQLQAAQGITPSKIPENCKSVLLRQGMRGECVKAIQEILGVNPKSGIFGPLTFAAVKKYQETKGLKSDGMIGRLTWGSF
jgi:hypothetical protein